MSLEFGRIQFTPDLMPGDVLGTNLFNFQTNSFQLVKGPIFTELLLADEINRTPPKTQAALLQAMQERAGHDRRHDPRARPRLHRDRDPEPDRAGGHLPAARGAARPLPVQAHPRLPDARRGAGDRHPARPQRHHAEPRGPRHHRRSPTWPASARAAGRRGSPPVAGDRRLRRRPGARAPASTRPSSSAPRRAPPPCWPRRPAPSRARRPRLRDPRRRQAPAPSRLCATAWCWRPARRSRA